jgi:hypothetical protein
MAVDEFQNINNEIPHRSPVEPVELQAGSEFQFCCHPDIACFNECCRNIDITLTPYDIIRLKRRFEIRSDEFVARYTVPFAMDGHGMPGLKLATKPGAAECVFLGEQGCAIYEDRPVSCRYYALGNMGVRKKDRPTVEDIFFVVKESHCLGHFEEKHQTVQEYRLEQGIEDYDDSNREWRDIVLKKRSSGPTVGKPSDRSLQLFDMCSYDIDSFREFVCSVGFSEVFDIAADDKDKLLADEDALLTFAFRFLKQVLYGEQTIPLKDDAGQRRQQRRVDAQHRDGDDS